jgi:hypothetical protein
MNIAFEDLTCPHCGKWIATRREIRDHLTLKLCQSPSVRDDRADMAHVREDQEDRRRQAVHQDAGA